MKRGFTLLLASMMLVFALTACGGGNDNAQDGTANQNDSAVMGGDTANNGGNGAGSSANGGANSGAGDNGGNSANSGSGANGGDSLLNDAGNAIENGVQDAERAIDDMTGTNNTRTGGVSYGQMMRNGRVHDTDGNLKDHENAATPGTTF